MPDLFTMKTNLTRKRHRYLNQTLKNCATRFQKVFCGLRGQIRCTDLSGYVLVTELEQKTTSIDGCDWRGAVSLYFNLQSDSPLLSEQSKFFFMLPEDTVGQIVKTCRQTVFLAMFHHLHNHLMIRAPDETPPFQIPIQEKYDYLRCILIEDMSSENFGDLDLNTLEAILSNIQESVHFKAYSSWNEFRSVFQNPWVSYSSFTDTVRLNKLAHIVTEPEDFLDFLAAPLDHFFKPTIQPIGQPILLDKLLNLVLQKLDCQEILTMTGIMPKEQNWLQELDCILKGLPGSDQNFV